MKKISLLFFVFGAAFNISTPAKCGPLKIETIQGAPWGFVGRDGRTIGMMFEIGNRIAEEAGFNYTNSLVPYARTAADIENGSADITLRFGNEHMARVAVPVASIISMPVILIGQKGTHYTNLNELQGKIVGVIRTSNLVARFDRDLAIQKYPVNDYVTMAKMLAARRLDAGAGSSLGLFYGAYMAGVRPAELGAPLVLGSNDFILFASRKCATPAVIESLKDALKKLEANGEIGEIVARYTPIFDVRAPRK